MVRCTHDVVTASAVQLLTVLREIDDINKESASLAKSSIVGKGDSDPARRRSARAVRAPSKYQTTASNDSKLDENKAQGNARHVVIVNVLLAETVLVFSLQIMRRVHPYPERAAMP